MLLRCRGLPGSLVLAGRILALGLVLAGRILALGLVLAGLALALLSRRLRNAGLTLPPARCRLLLSATALRGSRATALPATALRGSPASALPATGGQSPTRGAATTGEAAATSASASTPPSLRIHLAHEAQHENARNE